MKKKPWRKYGQDADRVPEEKDAGNKAIQLEVMYILGCFS